MQSTKTANSAILLLLLWPAALCSGEPIGVPPIKVPVEELIGAPLELTLSPLEGPIGADNRKPIEEPIGIQVREARELTGQPIKENFPAKTDQDHHQLSFDSKPWIPSPPHQVSLSRSARHPEAVVGRELGGSSLIDPNLRSNLVDAEEEVPATQKLILGDWIAQWDTTYGAWFFYNINTEESTWIKPKELEHVVFNAPTKEELGAAAQLPDSRLQAHRGKQKLAPGTPGIPTWDSVRTPFRNQPLRLAPAQEKILLESTSGDFFGFNTTSFSNRGVLGGIRDSLTGIYDNIVKDYVTDVYTDVIEGYTIATIKLMGWFFFGGFLLAKGALINSIVNSGGRSMGEGELSLAEWMTGARSVDGSPVNYTLPFMTDLELTFPIEESLLTCYRGRESCLNNDLPKEVETLMTNISDMREFFDRWVELFERVEHMVIEGEDGL